MLRGSLRSKKLVRFVAWELQPASLQPQHVLRLVIQQMLPSSHVAGLLDDRYLQNDGRGPRNSRRMLLVANSVFVVWFQRRIGLGHSARPELPLRPELQLRRGKATDLIGAPVEGPTEPEGVGWPWDRCARSDWKTGRSFSVAQKRISSSLSLSRPFPDANLCGRLAVVG
jgi:hypothetical protein